VSKKEKIETYIEEVSSFLSEKICDPKPLKTLSGQILTSATEGLELDSNFEEWFENRFKYQFTWLDKDDYSKALVRALWLAPVFAGTDFGSSRQRDMGQIWTDTARGFLGEIAVSNFLYGKFGIQTGSDTRRGDLSEFLPTDIVKVKFPNNDFRSPRLRISIKTTKFNGRWLDAPGAQIEHSDIFILAKVGVLTHHFLAFLKAISFLKDKLFPRAVNLGELNEEMAQELWDEIPHFDPIPAYIAGYLNKSELNFPIHELICHKKRGKDPSIIITQGVGLFTRETLRNHPKIKELDPDENLRIEIEPIIKDITSPHFWAHSGSLKWGEEAWSELFERI